VACATFGIFGAAQAQEADFYRGKTLNIVVGFSTGGGYDAYARLLSHHIGRHIPGNPKVVVQNMPGAASRRAIQYLDTTAPSDGTAIVLFNFGQITSSMVMPPTNMTLDFRNYAWIGSMNRDVSVCYVWKERFPSVATAIDLAQTRRKVIYGLTGDGSGSYFNQAMLKGVFDVNLRQVSGYPGSTDKQIAIERGELDGDCGEWSSVPDDWQKTGRLSYVMRSSRTLPEGMPSSVPWAVDLAPTEEKKQMVRLLTEAADLGRPFITRRDVPIERLNILRTAFDKAVRDPALLSDALKTGRQISPMNADEARSTLDELYAICDRVTIMRDGQTVAKSPMAEMPKMALVRHMLGKELAAFQAMAPDQDVPDRPLRLAVENAGAGVRVRDVSLDVRQGEISGLAGLLGSGRTETARLIFGADTMQRGTMRIEGRERTYREPADAIADGIGLVSEDRKIDGIVPDMSIRENMTLALLPKLKKAGIVDRDRQDEIVTRYIRTLGVKCASPDQPIKELSGGNQQKVLLARWLATDPRVLIIDEPTRGIDVGTKAEVHRLLSDLAGQGVAILMISSELPEVLGMADRVLVVCEGRITADIARAEATPENVMAAATRSTTATKEPAA